MHFERLCRCACFKIADRARLQRKADAASTLELDTRPKRRARLMAESDTVHSDDNDDDDDDDDDDSKAGGGGSTSHSGGRNNVSPGAGASAMGGDEGAGHDRDWDRRGGSGSASSGSARDDRSDGVCITDDVYILGDVGASTCITDDAFIIG